jgi:hypothetical protein
VLEVGDPRFLADIAREDLTLEELHGAFVSLRTAFAS